SPCLTALRRDRSFPCSVRGPRLLAPFRRAASARLRQAGGSCSCGASSEAVRPVLSPSAFGPAVSGATIVDDASRGASTHSLAVDGAMDGSTVSDFVAGWDSVWQAATW